MQLEEPVTPSKVAKNANGLKSPLHKQLETPAPSSPTAPRTPEAKHERPILTTPRSLRAPPRVPLTPGGRLFVPSSPMTAQIFGSSERSVQQVPPMPLPTLFLSKEKVDAMDDAELRPQLHKALEQIEDYERSARQFRNLASNLMLQTRLQSFETSESAQRHEVESTLQKKEIEALVAEFVGQTETVLDAETVRRRLKKTRQRLKDLEQLCATKDSEIIQLRAQVKSLEAMPPLRTMHSPTRGGSNGHMHGPSHMPPHGLSHVVIPPPMPSAGADFSPLEMLATQVLTGRMRRGSSSSTISATSEDERM